MPEHAGSEPGRRALRIVRGLMDGFPLTAETAEDWNADRVREASELLDASDRQVTYQLAALCAALIRVLGAETGRTENEILEELASNF